MPITAGSVAVGTVATQLNTSYSMPGSLHISNLDNTDTVFIGGATVTVNNGHALAKSTSEDFVVPPSQSLYAVSSKTGHSVSYLFITP
jgi:hypothetical protein